MTSYVPPVKNGASGWIGYVSLAPRVPTGTWQSNPTLATGDVKVSIDGGALANLGTLPAVTPASSKLVKITLSQAEINGDNITIIFSDAAGAEWCDLTVPLQTVTRQIDDLAYPTTSGRSIDVSAGGEVGIDWANVGSPTTTVGLSGTTISTSQAVASVSGAVASVTNNVNADVVKINTSSAAAARLALSAGVIIPGTVATAGFSPTTVEFEASDITEATADHYNGRVIIFTSGALLGQATSISDYVLTGGRGHITVVAMTEAPANSDTFIII